MSDLAWLHGVRLKYGPAVSLVDLSAGGAQIETEGHRLAPGTTVAIEIATRSGDFVVPSRIVRCHVTGISRHTLYRGALAFKRPFTFSEMNDTSAREADRNPVHEYARLVMALRRLSGSSGFASAETGLIGMGDATLAAVLTLMESPAGRRAGASFSRELSRLFTVITDAIEAGDCDDSQLSDELAEQLRRAVPARSIRLVDRTLPVLQTQDAICIDIATEHQPASKLLVEFPRSCRLEEWHFQLLKAAALLIALVKEVQRVRDLAEQRAREDALVNRPGWHRIVARYRDGRMIKGFGRDFFPAKGQVHIWPVVDGPPTARITIHLAHLKAVFFVHNLEGGEPGVGAATGVNQLGRTIEVTFLDGEVLAGTTLNYSAEGPGFFLIPSKPETNNLRVFAVNSAVSHVRFP